MMRILLLSASVAFVSIAAHAQDAAPRQYKLQQPGLVEQMRHMKPIGTLQPTELQAHAVSQQVLQCWKPEPATAQKGLVVVLNVGYNPDGAVDTVALGANQAKLLEDNDFRLAVKSAMDAAKRCSPLKNMAAIPYDQWRETEVTFAPSVTPGTNTEAAQ